MCVHFSKAAGLYHCWICSVCVAVSACTCLPDGHKPAPQQSMSFTHTFHFLQSASIQTLRGINSIYLLVGFFCRCRRTSLEHTLSPHTPLHSRTHFSLKVFSLLSQSAGEIRLHTGEKRSHSDEWCAQLQHNALLLMCY